LLGKLVVILYRLKCGDDQKQVTTKSSFTVEVLNVEIDEKQDSNTKLSFTVDRYHIYINQLTIFTL